MVNKKQYIDYCTAIWPAKPSLPKTLGLLSALLMIENNLLSFIGGGSLFWDNMCNIYFGISLIYFVSYYGIVPLISVLGLRMYKMLMFKKHYTEYELDKEESGRAESTLLYLSCVFLRRNILKKFELSVFIAFFASYLYVGNYTVFLLGAICFCLVNAVKSLINVEIDEVIKNRGLSPLLEQDITVNSCLNSLEKLASRLPKKQGENNE